MTIPVRDKFDIALVRSLPCLIAGSVLSMETTDKTGQSPIFLMASSLLGGKRYRIVVRRYAAWMG